MGGKVAQIYPTVSERNVITRIGICIAPISIKRLAKHQVGLARHDPIWIRPASTNQDVIQSITIDVPC